MKKDIMNQPTTCKGKEIDVDNCSERRVKY